MNINYENVKAAYYRGQNILKIYSGSTLEWEYETEPMEQTTKQIWYNSVSGDVVEPYAASAMGTLVSNTAYESKCVLEYASDITAIGANAFSGCTDLEYVSIPVSATSIGDNAFDGCSALDDIYMPSVQRIGRESFKDCAFTAFTVPTSVTAITADAFKGVAIEEFNYNSTKAQWSGITYGDFWDEDTWITNVIHCSDGDIELYQYDYSKRYLEFVATSGGTFQFSGSSTANTISYSTDQGKTWSTPAQVATVNVNSGDSVMWKGEMTPNTNKGIGVFSGSTASFDAQGNTMSLLYGENYKNQTSLSGKNYAFTQLFSGSKVVNASNMKLPSTTLADSCYASMFIYCTSLTTAPSILPATTLANSCYYYMFSGCTSLTTAPQLPATTLANYCYDGMFYGCTSLTTAPQLPATTLASACYSRMFEGCTSLTTAPSLQATTLAEYCYDGMFKGCTSLTQAPQLPATTLNSQCYSSMFFNCTSLTTAPELPATNLYERCYSSMFSGCRSLTTAPSLLATTLANYCYDGMFSGCRSLTTAPSLLATTLANYCCREMFYGCTSLTTAPQLPATTLATNCYNSMFEGCTSLTTAPQLPATTLANSCYYGMFRDCTSLNYIKMLATDISANGCLNMWVYGVADSGTFVKAASMASLPTGMNGIPNGWTVEDFPPNHLRFVAKSGGTFNFSGSSTANTISYSTDSGDTWSTPAQVVSVNVNSGDTVLWKGEMTPDANNGIGNFGASTAPFDAQGNPMSLLYGDNYKNQTSFSGKNYGLRNIFRNSKVVNAEKLKLPAITLVDYCYAYMFLDCKSLITTPQLPATTLGYNCYYRMFQGCTALTTAPSILPATALTNNCYQDMFNGCTSLTTAPTLPATTMAASAYTEMFSGCTSLTTAPSLPATTLADACYLRMFSKCTSLTAAPQLPSTGLTSNCYANMFQGCTALTAATQLPATTLANQCYLNMYNGCTSLTTAPDLSATTLVSGCYGGMFYGCTNLNYIKMLATDISASACLNNWVGNVANSGTFVKAASMTTLPTGSDGIPSGWTVQDDGASPEHDYSQDYFTIVAKDDGEIQVQPECVEVWNPGEGYEDPETGEWIEGEGYSEYYACLVQYSVNDGVWQTITADTSSPDTFVIEVSNGDEIRFKCNLANEVIQNPYNMAEWYTFEKPCSFNTSQGASFDVQGNIMSLVYGDDFENNNGLTYEYSYLEYGEGDPVEATNTCDVCFGYMFTQSNVVNAENLVLPSTTVNKCYDGMFSECYSLTTAPQLPATTLVGACYYGMFRDCTSLTQAPELPAAILTTQDGEGCYQELFQNCTSLNYIKMLATDISETSCLSFWVEGVANSGTFVKDASMTSLPTGDNGIPNGWTVEDAA